MKMQLMDESTKTALKAVAITAGLTAIGTFLVAVGNAFVTAAIKKGE